MLAGFAHMASLVVQWTHVLHEDSDVHQDPSLPANVDESYFLRVATCLQLHDIVMSRAESTPEMEAPQHAGLASLSGTGMMARLTCKPTRPFIC